MKSRCRVMLAALAALTTTPAMSTGAAGDAGDMQHPDRLAGEMFIAGATLVDPPPGERDDTHAYLSLSGPAARRLFRALKTTATTDACSPERRLKTVGALRCSVGRKTDDARCDFAIDLVRGVIAPNSVC